MLPHEHGEERPTRECREEFREIVQESTKDLKQSVDGINKSIEGINRSFQAQALTYAELSFKLNGLIEAMGQYELLLRGQDKVSGMIATFNDVRRFLQDVRDKEVFERVDEHHRDLGLLNDNETSRKAEEAYTYVTNMRAFRKGLIAFFLANWLVLAGAAVWLIKTGVDFKQHLTDTSVHVSSTKAGGNP